MTVNFDSLIKAIEQNDITISMALKAAWTQGRMSAFNEMLAESEERK